MSWRVGLGRVSAFTSDVKNRWAAQWLSWSGFGKFWSQVVRDAMRQGASKGFRVKASIEEGKGRIWVDAIDAKGKFLNYLNAYAWVLDPRLKRKKVKLKQRGPGFYEGHFEARRHGAYMVKARFARGKTVVGRGQASASYAYPLEWLSAGPALDHLRAIAKAGGGRFEPTSAQAWRRDPGEKLLAHKPLWPYLVLLALIFFLLDLFLRRVRLFGRAAFLTQRKGTVQ